MPTTNLEKLHQIMIGGMVDLEILTATSSKRVKTEFIGLLDKRFVILNYPNAKRFPAASDYLYDGEMVVVRALIEGSGGQVIAFRQQLMSVSSHPVRLLFINFPNQVELFDLRSQTRIPTLLSAKLKLSDDRILDGVIKDISLTGIKFDLKDKAQAENIKGMQCSIILDSSNRQAKDFKGEICSVKEHAQGVYCGIKLLASEEEMKSFMGDHFIDPSILQSETE